MKFTFTVEDAENVRIQFFRNPWIGTMRTTADGRQVAFVDPTHFSTYFNFQWVKRYTFLVGKADRHEVTIEHERPRILGGLQPNTYCVFVDGRKIDEHSGY